MAIWTITLAPGARWTLPAAHNTAAHRMLYWFVGESLTIAGDRQGGHEAMELASGEAVELFNSGSDPVELLMLQGVPIAERVVQYGPFVMNTEQEIRQAMQDFRSTQFGGWPWKESDPVHGAEVRRFARHPGAQEEEVPQAA